MPNLESDIVGQVERPPLKPSEANALLPLYEALSNSLHAIQDWFGDGGIAIRGRDRHRTPSRARRFRSWPDLRWFSDRGQRRRPERRELPVIPDPFLVAKDEAGGLRRVGSDGWRSSKIFALSRVIKRRKKASPHPQAHTITPTNNQVTAMPTTAFQNTNPRRSELNHFSDVVLVRLCSVRDCMSYSARQLSTILMVPSKKRALNCSLVTGSNPIDYRKSG